MKIFYNYLNFNLKKTLNATLAFALAMFLMTPVQANVIITAVYDCTLSGGTPKGVELYVTADVADLSVYGIGSANNGQGTDGEEFTFPVGAYTAGSFIYVATDSMQFMTYFGFEPNFADGSMAINGDDAVELYMNGSVIDIFGDIDVDGNGTNWEYLDSWAYRNNGTGPDGTTFVESNWTYGGVDALDGCTDNASCASVVPFGSYTTEMSDTPEFGFTSSGIIITEGDTANIDVALNIPTDCTVDVTLSTSGTAPAADYMFMNQTLTFTAGGDLVQTLTVPTVDNSDTDGERTVVLNLENNGGTCGIGVVDQVLITITDNDYQAVDIVDVTGEDADGVATSLGDLVQVTGIVYCIDFRGGGGYDFALVDDTGAISVFGFDDVNDYVVTEGDELQVSGEINQFRGLTQLAPDEIEIVSQGNSASTFTEVSDLSEATESLPITLSGVSVIDPSQIGEAGSSYNVDLLGPTGNTITMRIDSDANIAPTDIPVDVEFEVSGVGGQFGSSSAPFLDGYQIRPCSIGDFVTNIDPALGEQFVIFPNPVNDLLTIQTNMNDYQITIRDMLGRQVLTQQANGNVSLNTSDLTKGIYLITINTEDRLWSAEKIMKN